MPRVILKKRSETTKQVRFGEFGGGGGGGGAGFGGGGGAGGGGNTDSGNTDSGNTGGGGPYGGPDGGPGDDHIDNPDSDNFGGGPTGLGNFGGQDISGEFTNDDLDFTDSGFGDFNFQPPDPSNFDPNKVENYHSGAFWQETSADPETANKVVGNLDGTKVIASNQGELATTVNQNVDIENLSCEMIENLNAEFFSNLDTEKLIKMTSTQLGCISESGASGLSEKAIKKLKYENRFKDLKKDVQDSLNDNEDTKKIKDTNERIQQIQEGDEPESAYDQETENMPELTVGDVSTSEGSELEFNLVLNKAFKKDAIIKAQIQSSSTAVLGKHYDRVNNGRVYNTDDITITNNNGKNEVLSPLQHINRNSDLDIEFSKETTNKRLVIRTVSLADEMKKNGVTIKIKFTCVDDENKSLIKKEVLATGTITDLKIKEEETTEQIEDGKWKVKINGKVNDDDYEEKSTNMFKNNAEICTFLRNNVEIFKNADGTKKQKNSDSDIKNSITSIIFQDIDAIPNNLLQNCTNLNTITIPNTVTSIGKHAFSNTAITSFTVEDHVKTLGTEVFYGCKKLTRINFNTSSLGLENSNKNFHHYLPTNICSNCLSLTTVRLHDNITGLGHSVFSGCNKLKISGLPLSNIKNLWDSALRNCGQGSSKDTFKIPKNINLLSQNILNGTSVTTIDATNITNFDNISFHSSGKIFSPLNNIIVKLSSSTIIPTDNDNFSLENKKFYGATNVTFKQNSKVVQIETNDDYYARITGERNGNEYTIDLKSSDNRITKIRDVIQDNTASNQEINNTIKKVTFNICPGNKIPDNAFSQCTGLTNVTIGDSVTSIGSGAFSGCSGLTSVTIGSNVTTIGQYVFKGCTSLTTMSIPNTVKTIASGIFWQCTGLTTVNWNSPIDKIPVQTFYECSGLTSVTIGNSVTSIGEYAFYKCSGLTSLGIPDSITRIGNHAFNGCSNLTSVTIPDSVTSIGTSVFKGCSGFTSVTIPDKVTSIGENAFFGCSGLTSVTIPDSVTSIGTRAFSKCTKLKTVTIQNSSIEDNNLGTRIFNECEALTTVTFPTDNNINTIKNRWFYDCNNLTSVKNLNNITSIEEFAFAYCSKIGNNINSIIKNVTKIGNNALRATNMTQITLSSITDMDANALSNINYSSNITVILPNSKFFETYTDKETKKVIQLTNDTTLKEFYGKIPNRIFIIKKPTKSLGRKGIIIR